MTYHVLGLGQTIAHYIEQNPEGRAIGVNVASRYVNPLWGLVVIDSPHVFTADRLEHIYNTQCDVLFSSFTNYDKIDCKKFEQLRLYSTHMLELDGRYYHSNNSPFVAVQAAYYHGAGEVVLWGVDMTDHHALTGQLSKVQRDFDLLVNKLSEKGVKVYKGHKDSRLNLPVWA